MNTEPQIDPSAIPTPRATRANTIEDRYPSHWTLKEKIRRFSWEWVARLLFWPSFRKLDGWRCWLLRRFGAKIGKRCIIRPTVKIIAPWNLEIGDHSSVGDHVILYNLATIKLGDRVSISQYAHLCAGTHDHTRMDMPLIKSPITLGDDVWLTTEVFVGPGVTIGDGVVVGARGTVVRDLPAWTVCVGSPAKPIKQRVLTSDGSAGKSMQAGGERE